MTTPSTSSRRSAMQTKNVSLISERLDEALRRFFVTLLVLLVGGLVLLNVWRAVGL